MEEWTQADLEQLLELNRLREKGGSHSALERRFADGFSAHHHLAVYGSLAPGRVNHHHVSPLGGEWHTGCFVTGDLIQSGWGTDLGYPALRWHPSGPPVPIQLLISDQLPHHWARLDDFEGPEYLRILVPVHKGDTVITVANLYASRL
jgi:gamma-glutamylcyclotransferase (GGCT)/AIG2-like uncharacterized protein YtfP